MYTLKLTSYQIEKLRELIDKRYYKLIDELHTLKEIDEQIEDEIYCVDECKEECNQENKYDCPHFQQHQEELEEDEDDCYCEDCCECENKEKEIEEDKKSKLHFDEDWENEDNSTKAVKENESVWDFEEEIKPVIEEPKDIYKEVKECLSKEPIFDINENDEKLVETIFDENLPSIKLEIDLAKNNKLTTTWGDIYLRHRRIIITTPNIYNLMAKNTILQSMSTSALFNENGTMNYSLGQIDDPINDLKYLVFFSQEVDKDKIIIINDDKVRWGYIREKPEQIKIKKEK